DLVAGADPGIGQIRTEWGEAAAVAGDLDPVGPDGGVVVDGAEVQDGAQPVPVRRHGHPAAVPDRLEEVAVADAGGLGLGREGHGDRPVELALEQAALAAGVGAVDLELPGAVEVEPGGPPAARRGRTGWAAARAARGSDRSRGSSSDRADRL